MGTFLLAILTSGKVRILRRPMSLKHKFTEQEVAVCCN